MKILLITYSREVNPGTFLQALGVKLKLTELFPSAEIDLLQHDRIYSFVNKKEKISLNYNFILGKIKAIPRRLKYEILYRKYFKFSKCKFNLFTYNKDEFKLFAESYDLISVGSDTILTKLFMDNSDTDQFGLMWLEGISTSKILFSASAAPCNFTLNENIVDRLKFSFSNFKYITVRDKITADFLNEQVGIPNNVYQLPDPTFFISDTYFKYVSPKLIKIAKTKKIVLVNFGEKFIFKSNITKFLRTKGYYVVSTHFNKDADVNLMNLNPFQWGGLFTHVSIVFTDRFHDTVFGLRYIKQVFTLEWDSTRYSNFGYSKALDILEKYNLSKFHFIIDNEVCYLNFVKKFDEYNSQDLMSLNDYNKKQISELMNVKFDLLK